MQNLYIHDGTFHLDDVALTAFIKLIYPDIKVIRTRDKNILAKALLDKNSIVADVARKYQPELHNYDHHQDKNLPSAFGLIWRHFAKDAFRKVTSATDEMIDDLYEKTKYLFVNFVDAYDVNQYDIIGRYGKFNKEFDFKIPNLSDMIRWYNNIENGFDKAVVTLTDIIHGVLIHGLMTLADEQMWDETHEVLSKYATLTPEHNIMWKKAKLSLYHVSPDATHSGQWKVSSRNSTLYPLPKPKIRHQFYHNAKFLASFYSKEDAVNYAKSIKPTIRQRIRWYFSK